MNVFKIAFRVSSGGAPIFGDHEKTEMTLRDLLEKDIAYLKDVEEIDADPNHPDRDWEVYVHVKNIQDGLNPNKLSELPPIQIVKNRVVDGAHRLNALNLMSKEDKSILSKKLKVEVYDEAAYRDSLKALGKVM